MAKGNNQKLKMLYLTKIFMEKTDETHALTLSEISSYLRDYNVTADRKTLYMDFAELKHYGLDIITEQQGRSIVYRLASRQFELAELKLLVDSVQSSKFITEKKSHELIKKLESLASENEARQLQRDVIIAGRVKTINESIYYNVDKLHSAISENKQVEFQYFQWNVEKQMELRHDGKEYHVSPWHLVWDDENYYLIGYDAEAQMIKHYRVDKMLHINISDSKRDGQDQLKDLDIAAYSKHLFGMLGGETIRITLRCENSLAGVIIDRFGKDIPMHPDDDAHFIAKVDAIASKQFIGWIIGLGTGVQILSPDSLVDEIRQIATNLTAMYHET